MLDNLLDMVKGNLGDFLQNQEQGGAIASQANPNEIADVAGQTILSKLGGMANGGDFSGIMEMFSGQETPADHPLASNLQGDVAENLMKKLGLNSNVASSISSMIIPFIMNMFNKKVQNNGGFDISSIISQFTGGGNANSGGGGIGDLIQGFLGGDENKSNAGGGGLFDKLKGLFG